MSYFYQNEFSINSISNISESYNDELLSESVITDSINTFTNVLMDFGITVGNFAENIQQCAEDIAGIIKKEGLNGKSQKKIISIFEKFIQTSGDIYIDSSVIVSKNPSFAEIESKRLVASLQLFMVVLMVNTLVGIVLQILLGRYIGHSLLAIIVAPIVEELSKSIAIKGGFVKEYTIVFNVLEARQYIKRAAPVIGFSKIFIIRIKCALLHVTTTLLQWLTLNKNLLEKCGINPDDTETVNFVGRIIAIFIHGTWNFLATFSETFNRFIAG